MLNSVRDNLYDKYTLGTGAALSTINDRLKGKYYSLILDPNRLSNQLAHQLGKVEPRNLSEFGRRMQYELYEIGKNDA